MSKPRARTWRLPSLLALAVVLLALCGAVAEASTGDRLPEFGECVEVRRLRSCSRSAREATQVPAWVGVYLSTY